MRNVEPHETCFKLEFLQSAFFFPNTFRSSWTDTRQGINEQKNEPFCYKPNLSN